MVGECLEREKEKEREREKKKHTGQVTLNLVAEGKATELSEKSKEHTEQAALCSSSSSARVCWMQSKENERGARSCASTTQQRSIEDTAMNTAVP